MSPRQKGSECLHLLDRPAGEALVDQLAVDSAFAGMRALGNVRVTAAEKTKNQTALFPYPRGLIVEADV
jgi:hypothetical protein